MRTGTAELLERFRQKDRRALAELLTLVELGEAPPLPGPAGYPPIPTRVVGITGSGGAGKSTLVGELVSHLRRQGQTVAVLACDPQSPVTGGALLGDRIRVRFEANDEGVYFRSLSTRGAAGGVSQAVRPAIEWLKAFGFDVVLVETVGVGQDQIGVRDAVETLVLLVTPHTGDEVQWEKAGVLEVADIVVVNKSDLSGAQRVRQQLTSALSLGPQGAHVPILSTTAATGQGVKELWEAIEQRQ
ncbi:MAG: methylmalonyl Co-A mutase-associated GTPase MeaB [Planctomycetaceae bacterium]|nr:methylmalonyl Co-A mutase-associated GTPase MeaB [Planctomycetaceae bacterium]